MQDQPNFHYDFSYSLAFDPFEGIDLSQDIEDSEKQFVSWSDLLLNMQFITDPETHKIASLLFRLPVYRKAGLALLNICQAVHNSSSEIAIESELQKFREQLYSYRKQLERILGSDRNKYLPMVILCYYSTIQRMLEDQTDIEDDFSIFHTVFWELKGQLTNKQTMEGLISKQFNVDRFHKFMFTEKEVLQQQLARKKEKYSKNRQSMTSFRSSLMGQDKMNVLTFRPTPSSKCENDNPNANNHMYRSFKDIANMLTKESQPAHKPNIIGGKNGTESIQPRKLNFDSFKKRQITKTDFLTAESERKLPFGLKSPSPLKVESKPTQICFKRKKAC